MLALFVRFWLTTPPPVPESGQAAARARGQERYEGFVVAVGRRLARGASFTREVSVDAPAIFEASAVEARDSDGG